MFRCTCCHCSIIDCIDSVHKTGDQCSLESLSGKCYSYSRLQANYQHDTYVPNAQDSKKLSCQHLTCTMSRRSRVTAIELTVTLRTHDHHIPSTHNNMKEVAPLTAEVIAAVRSAVTTAQHTAEPAGVHSKFCHKIESARRRHLQFWWQLETLTHDSKLLSHVSAGLNGKEYSNMLPP